jgi:Uma2 family endonuclease
MLPEARSATKLTYRDFVRFPDDGMRHELIDGVHYVTASPFTPHQRVLANLHYLVRHHLETHGGGQAFFAPFDVIFSMLDIVEPDLLFISDARKEILTRRNVRGAPDLVVEILSESTRRRDEGVKLRLYERSTVLEYWVIDPDAEWIRVYRRTGEVLALVDELRRPHSTVLKTPLIPGLDLALDRIFG